MKRIKCIGILLLMLVLACRQSQAQSIAQDLEQLELDYQKLAGLKSILKQMYTGYEVLDKGYGAVKGVSKGNFNLHEAFLDGLMTVSPTVRKYRRIQDIVSDQLELVSEYKMALNTFKQDSHFSPDEISYMTSVYNNLVSQSLNNLSELTTVMTDNKLRMSDHERLAAIDRIYATGHDQLTFLRKFNNDAEIVAIQRANIAGDKQTLKTLYGTH